MRSRFALITLAWFAFMVIAVTSGVLREWLLTPRLGEHAAHRIGTLFVCMLIASVIVHAIRRLRPTPAQALGIGAAWAVMTVAFEVGVFHFLVGHPMSVLLADYNLAAARLWPLVLLTEWLTPWLVARSLRSDKPGALGQASAPPPAEGANAIPPCAGSTPDLPPDKSPRRVDSLPMPAEFRRAISKAEIADLPVRRYTGEVCVVNTAAALAQAMHDIRQETVVGFDTETRPAFRKGEDYLPCLVQIATARCVYLLQLQQLDCSLAVAELMANAQIVKAGVALANDVGQLRRLFPFEAAAVVDIGHIAKRQGNTQTGLRNLTALFLGWRMAKGARTTHWSAAQLTATQIGYAATDAWASREVYLRFEKLGWVAPDRRAIRAEA